MSNGYQSPSYCRPVGESIKERIQEPRRFIQVIAGPRQVGKTTLVRQVLALSERDYLYASADEPSLRGRTWLEQQWQAARLHSDREDNGSAVLVLDEVQKITGWSEIVKRLWDEDTANGRSLKVFILGSSPLLVQQGLTESLAGRFELIQLSHWSYVEMRDAFGWDVHTYIFYGGYPGAAPLIEDPMRWSRYILDALIETTISRDVLLLNRVDKPALLRRLFDLACQYSGQILSYTKMLGQLQEAGNTTTLAHYLDLLSGAGMVGGLQKYSGRTVRKRASSPKLQVMNTALMTAPSGLSLLDARADHRLWGRIVESSIGAHLVNAQLRRECRAYYWRAGNHEVDFVIESPGKTLTAIEVKSGRASQVKAGMEEFARQYGPVRKLLVGEDGVPIDEFLARPVAYWIGT
jgi:uncharacterized protein